MVVFVTNVDRRWGWIGSGEVGRGSFEGFSRGEVWVGGDTCFTAACGVARVMIMAEAKRRS